MLELIRFHKFGTIVGFLAGVVASVAVAWVLPSNNLTTNHVLTCEGVISDATAIASKCQASSTRTSTDISNQIGGLLLLSATFGLMVLSATASTLGEKVAAISGLSAAEEAALVTAEYKAVNSRVLFISALSLAAVAIGAFVAMA